MGEKDDPSEAYNNKDDYSSKLSQSSVKAKTTI
jgi:hypothetical protein